MCRSPLPLFANETTVKGQSTPFIIWKYTQHKLKPLYIIICRRAPHDDQGVNEGYHHALPQSPSEYDQTVSPTHMVSCFVLLHLLAVHSQLHMPHTNSTIVQRLQEGVVVADA